MQLKIKNFLGVKSAEVELQGVTLVAGLNAGGKTSLALAAGAALTGTTLPIPGMRKTDSGMLVGIGSSEGRVEIVGDAGSISITWPSCTPLSTGTPPTASSIAAGMERLSGQQKLADRVKMMSRYIKAEPTEKDLSDALPGVSEESLQTLWRSVQVNGWDQAWERAKQNGQQFKGQWKEVAGGTVWGSKQGPSWTPEGWDEKLRQSNEPKLVEWVGAAKALLEDGIRQQAVQAVDLDRLRTLAAETVDLDAARSAQSDALKVLNDAKAARNALPSDKETHASLLNCAHCGGENQLVQIAGKTTLTKPGETISRQEIKVRGLAVAKAEGLIANLEGKYQDATRVLNQETQRAREIESAKTKLSAIQNQPQGQAVDLNALRTTVSNRELKLKAYQLKTRADAINVQIEQNLKIVELLAPDGLRAVKQQQAISEFVEGCLIPASKAAGWGEVGLTGEMVLTYRGRTYPLCSESEKLRMDATLQVACAILDESGVVIVDRADTLDRGGFGGLIRLLRWAKIPSIVCSTYGDPDRPPKDFQKLGIGRTYWMEGGQVVSINQKAA